MVYGACQTVADVCDHCVAVSVFVQLDTSREQMASLDFTVD